MNNPEDLVSTHDLTEAELDASFAPLGRFITAHTQLDLLVGRMLAAFVGLNDHLFADHLIHSVESGRKKQMLDAIATIFKTDPLGIIEGYQPNPDLNRRIKSFAMHYEEATKRRNVLCHGTSADLKAECLSAPCRRKGFSETTALVTVGFSSTNCRVSWMVSPRRFQMANLCRRISRAPMSKLDSLRSRAPDWITVEFRGHGVPGTQHGVPGTQY